jgi:uncharacterized protein (TIRG00374 family)
VLALVILIIVASRGSELERFADLLRAARPEWLLMMLALQTMTYVCLAGIWQRALSRAGQRSSLPDLIGLALAKLFTDDVLPSGGLSGIALLLRGLARRKVLTSLGMETVLLSIISSYFTHVLLVLLSVGLLWTHGYRQPVFVLAAVVFVAFALVITSAAVWLVRHGGRRIPAWIARLFPVFVEAARMAPETSRVSFYRSRLLAEATTLQLAIIALDALTMWCAFSALGQSIDLWRAFVGFMMASVVAMIGFLPLGPFEIGSVGMLTAVGVPVEAALAATLLQRGFTFWLPMIPGMWLTRREFPSMGSRTP